MGTKRPPTSPTPERSRSRPWVRWGAGATAALVGISLVYGITSSLADTPEAPITESSPAPEEATETPAAPLESVPDAVKVPLSGDEAVEAKRASAALETLVAAADEIAQRGDGSTEGAEEVATGWVLGELEAQAAEQRDRGFTQVGASVVTSITPTEVDLAASPATMTLTVCVDVSGIDVIDSAGNSHKEELYNPGHPVAHRYGAVFQDDTWKFTSHDIPDVQDCPTS